MMLKCIGILFLLVLPYMATDGFYSDTKTKLSKITENSDYTTTFYVSGKLMLAGKHNLLYPGQDITSIHETQYNREAHQLLPNMTPSLTAICPYFPLVPALFSPLTYLTPAYAFLAWQSLSVVALYIACVLIDKMRGQSAFSTFWLALIFLPVFHCLFVGQSAILLGLLPLTAGFFLLKRQRGFAGGLVLALTFLKPQLFITAGLLCLCMLFRKSYKPVLGLLTGVVSICLIAVAFFGVETMQRWLIGMQVIDGVYSLAKNGVVQTIVASVPRMAILASPTLKPIVMTSAGLLLLASTFLLFRAAKKQTDTSDYLDRALLLALCLIPLTAPYLFYYDLCVLVLAWAAIPRQTRAVAIAIACAIYINLYGMMLVIPPVSKLATPWILLLVYLEMYRRSVIAVQLSETSNAPQA